MFASRKLSDWWPTAAILLIAVGFRFWMLEVKPPHFDEGVNGWFVDQMGKNGGYAYDPTNYHGPLHFYVLFISQTLFGRSLWALRGPVALVSLAVVWLMLRFETLLPRHGTRWAALAYAVSPGATFYGRYAIHESWLVLFLVMMLFGITGLWIRGARSDLWWLGWGIIGTILTKETYAIHLVCFALAAGTVWLGEQVWASSAPPRATQQWAWLDVLKIVATGLALIVFFYSRTFLDWHLLAGLWTTFSAWTHTGQVGNGHDKPWPYWLELFWHYEWVAISGLVMLADCGQRGGDRWARFVATLGLGTLVAYSLIPYKTPWCIISLIWPFSFLFGAWVARAAELFPKRLVYTLAGLLLAAASAMAIHLNFFAYDDDAEPYVYVQTKRDLRILTEPLFAMARRDPANYALEGKMIIPSYHPIPWVLGDFTSIGYYDQKPPAESDADFVLVDNDQLAEVEAKFTRPYFMRPMKLRSNLSDMTLFLNAEKFGVLYPGEEPEFVPAPKQPVNPVNPEPSAP